MKEIKFDPFAVVADLPASQSAFNCNPVYISDANNCMLVKATITFSGDFFGGSIAAKFRQSDSETTGYADVTGGGFEAATEAGSQTIEFTLGSNMHVGTQLGNLKKWLALNLAVTGGDSGGTTAINVTCSIDNLGIPPQTITLKMPTTATPS